jgi:hypothetical protein
VAGIRPWIGVDLDGTLATWYDGQGQAIGLVIEPMRNLILDWIKEDECDVKIFTARVAQYESDWIMYDVQNWLQNNGMPRLEVTNIKDQYMVELYDDRAVQVEFNTGYIMGESTMKYRRLLKKA